MSANFLNTCKCYFLTAPYRMFMARMANGTERFGFLPLSRRVLTAIANRRSLIASRRVTAWKKSSHQIMVGTRCAVSQISPPDARHADEYPPFGSFLNDTKLREG